MTEQKQEQEYGFSDLSRYELEWRIVYACIVAGKSAKFVRKVMDKLFVFREQKTPLLFFDAMIQAGPLVLLETLMQARTGNYDKLTRTIPGLTQRVLHEDLDLSTCTPQELEEIHGIGPKTSRFFILWTREGVRVAALDVHILRWLKKQGYDVPKNTPQNGKRYREIEEIFLAEADKRGMSPRDLDYEIWAAGSGDKEFQPDERNGKQPQKKSKKGKK